MTFSCKEQLMAAEAENTHSISENQFDISDKCSSREISKTYKSKNQNLTIPRANSWCHKNLGKVA